MSLDPYAGTPLVWKAVVSALVVALAYGDIWRRTLPRAITVSAAVAGMGYHLWAACSGTAGTHAWQVVLGAALAGVLGLGIGLLLFALGALGGGDVKLISALGFILGWPLWLRSVTAAIMVAGAMGLVQAALSGRLMLLLRNLAQLAGWLATQRRAHPDLNIQNPNMIRSPFAVALALGVLWVLWL